MTRRELAFLQTARATNVCLDRFQDAWKNLSGFAEHREAIRAKMTDVEELAAGSVPDAGNLAGQRQLVIQAVAEEAWVVAGQVQAWAAANGDDELRDAVRTTRDELVSLQMGLPERGLEIHQRASECLRAGRGTDFGLSRERLEVLAERIQALKILRVPSARPVQGGKVEDGALSASLGQVMDLLCELLDPLMRRFRAEEPEFFEAYQAARRIVNPETGTLLTSDEDLASLAGEVVADAQDESQVEPGRRPVAPAAGSRTQTGAAALNS